jgi:hypothetical protein
VVGSGRGLLEVLSRHFPGGLKKSHENTTRISGDPAETRTEHLLNTCRGRYLLTALIDENIKRVYIYIYIYVCVCVCVCTKAYMVILHENRGTIIPSFNGPHLYKYIMFLDIMHLPLYTSKHNVLEIGTNSIDWAQLSRFYWKWTQNPVSETFWSINRKTDNVQKHNVCTNVPPSQTLRLCY